MKKLPAGSWIIVLLVALVGAAMLILQFLPAAMPKPDMRAIGSLPTPPVPDGVPSSSSLPVLANGMPDFVGISRWWNTPDDAPLTPESLKGKVVLVDFWTYSCINCIRTQPVLRAWWKAYEDKGLVIIGVHTPEFAFEKDVDNVEKALRKADLRYPIALDAEYGTWNTYANRYWPAAYLFDRQGRLRYTHFGEGEYDVTEGAIRELLAEGGMALEPPTDADSTPNMDMIKTPETYFGSARMRGFENVDEFKAGETATYTIRQPKANFWSVGGSWLFEDERAVALGAPTVFRMNVNANAAHIVLGSTDGKAKEVQVLIDGKTPTDEQLTDDLKRTDDGGAAILVQGMDLYRVARFPAGGEHTIELTFQDANVALYAATFGE